MCEIKTNCDDGIQKNTTTVNEVILHFTPLAPAPINWMKKKKEVWKEYLSSSISEHYHLPSPRTERLFLSPSSPSSNITPPLTFNTTFSIRLCWTCQNRKSKSAGVLTIPLVPPPSALLTFLSPLHLPPCLSPCCIPYIRLLHKYTTCFNEGKDPIPMQRLFPVPVLSQLGEVGVRRRGKRLMAIHLYIFHIEH